MAYCRSCGISHKCTNPRACDRPVDQWGFHLRAGKRYSQLAGRRADQRAAKTRAIALQRGAA